MYNSLQTLFYSVYIVWCTVSYLLFFLACLCLCGAIDGAQFEEPQDQGFEDAEPQQQQQ